MTSPNTWNGGSNPLDDIRKAVDSLRHATWPTAVEVTQSTLDALRLARSTAQRDQIVPGVGCLAGPYSGIPIFITDDLPDGKARICWSNGEKQVIP